MLNRRLHFISAQNIFGLALLVLALVSMATVNHFGIVPLKRLDITGVGNDFGVFWTGARVIMLRESPYDMSETSTYVAIQQAAGELGTPYQSPAFTALLFIPFGWLPLSGAAALWLTLDQVLLVASVVLTLRLFCFRRRRGYLLLCMVLAIVFRYTFVSFLVGQMSALLLFLLVSTIWAIRTDQHRLAGGLLALSLIKPQLAFLTVPLLLVGSRTKEHSGDHLALKKRIQGFSATAGSLTLVSLILVPTWPAEWLARLGCGFLSDSSIDGAMPSLRGVLAMLVSGGSSLPLLVATASPLILWFGWRWSKSANELTIDNILLSQAVSITLITAPYTREYDYVLLLFPAMLCLSMLSRAPRLGARLAQAALVLSLLLPYWIHPLAIRYGYGVEIIMPLLMLAFTWLSERLVKVDSHLVLHRPSLDPTERVVHNWKGN